MSDDFDFDPDNEEHWPELQDVAAEFFKLGCERDPRTWQDHKSLSTAWDRRYHIINPANGKFLTVLHPENTPLAPDVIDNWERRLGIIINKPWEREQARNTGPWSPPVN